MRVREKREVTGTWAVETGTLEAFFLDDEAGADEGAGDDGQNETDQIGGVHGRNGEGFGTLD